MICPCPGPSQHHSTPPGYTSLLSHVSTHTIPTQDYLQFPFHYSVFTFGSFQARPIGSLILLESWWPTRPAKKLQDLFLLILSPVKARTTLPPGDDQDPSEPDPPPGEREERWDWHTDGLSFQWQTLSQYWGPCDCQKSPQLWLRWKVSGQTPAWTH